MPRSSVPLVKRASSVVDKPYGKSRGALPKRVEANARVHIAKDEYVQLMHVWETYGPTPGSERIDELAHRLDRCRKQIAVWFSNRRQNIAKEELRRGRSLTDSEISALVWSKYRETAAERISRESGTSSSGSEKSASPVPSLSRTERSSSGSPARSTSSSVSYTPPPEPAAISRFDALLEVANAELEVYEACEILVGLSCQCPY